MNLTKIKLFHLLWLVVTIAALIPNPVTAKILEQIRMDGTHQTNAQKEVRTSYDDGFTLSGSDDVLKIGAWLQNDVRIFGAGHPGTTQFLIRRARIDLRGSLEKIFGYRLMGEFEGDGGTNVASLKEGWVEYNQFPTFRVKIGQFKEPFGLENLYGDLWLDFMERPIAENFIRPEQDLGVMISGKLFANRLEYGIGAFNGSGTNIAESNDDKDIAGRLALTPCAPCASRWLKQLTFGASGSYGKQTSTLDGSGPTTAAGTRFFSFANPTGGGDVTVNAVRLRAGGDVAWFIGPVSFKSEYAFSQTRDVTFGGTASSLNLHGLSAQFTWLLTGEDKTNQNSVIPKRAFNPREGHWGAVELALRGEASFSEQGFIDTGFATGTDDVLGATAGINWTLNRHIRNSINYVFTKFDDVITAAGSKDLEQALLMRFQFNL